MLKSLLYVSRRTSPADEVSSEVAAILAVARPRNLSLGVTGAMTATPTRFVQMLEGDEAALATLMASISRDDRHEDIRIVCEEALGERRFASWSMAQIPPTRALEALLDRLTGGDEREGDAAELTDMLRQASSAQLLV